jgi:hypothetical protein
MNPASSGISAGDTPVLQALKYGIQAPNPHNTQAWKFEPLSDTEAKLYLDERRLLPVTDPPARQIHIGAGCFIEMLAVGMSSHGYETDVDYLPEGAHGLEHVGRKPVARIRLRRSPTNIPDELASFIGERQTNRKPYRGPPLSEQEAADVRAKTQSTSVEVLIVDRREEMRPLLDIFYDAAEIEFTTPRLYEETRIWFRFNENQRQAHRDGLSIPQNGTDGVRRHIYEWSLRKGDPKRWFSKRSIKAALKNYRQGIDSATGLVLLKTRSNNQLNWLEAGRSFTRLQLALAKHGFTSHPYSQVLQEYPEMTELQSAFNGRLGVRQPEKIQMAVRIGHADPAYVARRRQPGDFLTAMPR